MLGDWQVRSARRCPVKTTVVDNPTGVEVAIGQEVASLLPPTLAVHCRVSINPSTQESSVCFPVGIRSRHFQQCGRMSLLYKSGRAMCRKPHQKLGPTGKALVQAEVTRKDTEHNTVSPVPQPRGTFGHILRPVLQQGVQEINTT